MDRSGGAGHAAKQLNWVDAQRRYRQRDQAAPEPGGVTDSLHQPRPPCSRRIKRPCHRLIASSSASEVASTTEAMAEAPDAPIIPFNDGNALYQTTDYQRAMEAYQRAIEAGDPALASSAWYNLGNTLYRQQQLQQSLEAFKQALRLNPQDGDAKHNLERVLEQMQEQQQQENDESQDEQDEDEEDQEEQEDQRRSPPPPLAPPASSRSLTNTSG